MGAAFSEFDTRIMTNEKLIKLSRFRTYSAHETIIGEHDESSEVYFLLEGRVKVTTYSIKGREVWHNELQAGRVFGEMAAISGDPRTATVIAVEKSKVAIISRAEFLELLRYDSEFSFWFMEELVSRLNIATSKFYELLSLSVPLRVRAELLRLCEGNGSIDNVIKPVPNLSELAKRINTDRENVSREISSLSKLGVVDKQKDQLTIIRKQYLIDSVSV